MNIYKKEWYQSKKESNLTSKDSQMNQLAFEVQSNHEYHVLDLRLKVATLLESFIVTKSSTQISELKGIYQVHCSNHRV